MERDDVAEGICSVDGCDEQARARGWCHRHYERWRLHGDPLTVLRHGGPAADPRVDDADWLRERYVEDGLTTAAIAAELGCAQATVSRALKRHAIPARSRTPVRHGHTSRAGGTRTYYTWQSMIRRCTNPGATHWERYGGRGIRVCERWLRFEHFLADMGERPEGRTLDRIDNDGDYQPGNCRWATWQEQSRHRERDEKGRYR